MTSLGVVIIKNILNIYIYIYYFLEKQILTDEVYPTKF